MALAACQEAQAEKKIEIQLGNDAAVIQGQETFALSMEGDFSAEALERKLQEAAKLVASNGGNIQEALQAVLKAGHHQIQVKYLALPQDAVSFYPSLPKERMGLWRLIAIGDLGVKFSGTPLPRITPEYSISFSLYLINVRVPETQRQLLSFANSFAVYVSSNEWQIVCADPQKGDLLSRVPLSLPIVDRWSSVVVNALVSEIQIIVDGQEQARVPCNRRAQFAELFIGSARPAHASRMILSNVTYRNYAENNGESLLPLIDIPSGLPPPPKDTGVSLACKEDRACYEKLSREGNSDATYFLAEMELSRTNGGHVAAFRLFNQSAYAGNAKAMTFLGNFLSGYFAGVPHHNLQATMWQLVGK